MSGSLRQRIERLEGERGNKETPHVIVATCPIPESDLPLRFDARTVARDRSGSCRFQGSRGALQRGPATSSDRRRMAVDALVGLQNRCIERCGAEVNMAGAVLTGCQPLPNMVEASQERMHMKKLFTVGYEGSKPSDLFASLQKSGVTLLIDPMSLQYLTGAEIDYQEGIEGAQFVIKNPNATSTCGCGSSFSA